MTGEIGILNVGAGDGTIKSGIYRIVHLPTNNEYIGQSKNIKRRFSSHLRMLRTGNHHSIHLQRAWDKYGKSDFSFEILAVCDIDHLTPLEQIMFDEFRPAFNVSRVAGSTRGVPISAARRAAMSVRFRGKKLTAEHRAKISRALKGRTPPRAQIEKANMSRRGVPLTDQHRLKLSEKLKGRKVSAKTRKRMRLSALKVWERRRCNQIPPTLPESGL